MKNKDQQTATDVLKWCEEQEDKTKKTIDYILDNKDWKDKRIKKALILTSKILNDVEKLKQETLDYIIK